VGTNEAARTEPIIIDIIFFADAKYLKKSVYECNALIYLKIYKAPFVPSDRIMDELNLIEQITNLQCTHANNYLSAIIFFCVHLCFI
jgi:hypothetical protein